MLYIVLDTEPLATPRPRSVSFGGRARSYMPKKYTAWKAGLVEYIKDNYTIEQIEQPVHLSLVFVYNRPKRLQRKKDTRSRILKCSRPDIDNLCKAAMDVLQDAGVFKDDAIVVSLEAKKFYGAFIEGKVEQPQIEIKIQTAF
jgi:Holliday junction resolvase RusA-like endonuclease